MTPLHAQALARALGLGPRRMRRWCAAGRLPAFRRRGGRDWFVRWEALPEGIRQHYLAFAKVILRRRVMPPRLESKRTFAAATK